MNGESINRGLNGAKAERKREQLAGEVTSRPHPLHSIPRRPDHCCETARQPVPPGDHPGAEKVLTDSRICARLKPVLFQTFVCWFWMFYRSEERNTHINQSDRKFNFYRAVSTKKIQKHKLFSFSLVFNEPMTAR